MIKELLILNNLLFGKTILPNFCPHARFLFISYSSYLNRWLRNINRGWGYVDKSIWVKNCRVYGKNFRNVSHIWGIEKQVFGTLLWIKIGNYFSFSKRQGKQAFP